MKINILDKQLANMIAAGEVVERPASAVKELVENAVDANAKSIVVEIKNGGMTYIRVTDDGDGIHPEEVVTAFARHATSKIKTKEDLDKIYTLGFRGEALASIAAVSRVEMFTKTRDFPYGKNVVIEGGEVVEDAEAGCPDGTTVIVRNLFFNTPARMKFLKSDAAETTAVTDVVNKMILCHPDVSIKLINNGKTVVAGHGNGDMNDCIHVVFGEEYAKNMIDVQYKEEFITITGSTGAFSLSRKDRRHQIFFLNGRNILNKTISAAVSEAYRNSVMVGKFPVCVLYIQIAPGLVDVNVHPTKMEVRFSEEKKVYSAVYWAVKEALSGTRHVPEIDEEKVFSLTKEEKAEIRQGLPAQAELPLKPSYADRNDKADSDGGVDELKGNIASAIMKNISSGQNRSMPYTSFEGNCKTARQTFSTERFYEKGADISSSEEKNVRFANEISSLHKDKEYEAFTNNTESGNGCFAEDSPEQAQADGNKSRIPAKESSGALRKEFLPNRDFVVAGQVFNTYIIAESGDDMLIIDQHAAHERIWFEELMKQWSEGTVSPQTLLIPVIISVDGHDLDIVKNNLDFFGEIGYEIDIFGADDIIIRKVPVESDDGVIRETVAEIIDILSKDAARPKHELYEKTLHTVACKKAIKGGKHLTSSDMEHLVSGALELDSINTCPHGRPICVRMSKTALEKQFKRIV